MDKSSLSQGKPGSAETAAPTFAKLASPGADAVSPAQAVPKDQAASTTLAAPTTEARSTAPAGPAAQESATYAEPIDQEKSLSGTQHVIELADGLSDVADQLHERIMREIRGYDDGSVPARVKDSMRKLLDDEMVLRQRANSLYADAAAFVIQGLDQPQSKLVALTADAAQKIRRIGVIGEVTGLVGGMLLLAGAVASGKPAPVLLALEKIRLHSKTLDALAPPPAS